MSILGWLIPVAGLMVLVVSSWEWMHDGKWWQRTPRGSVLLLSGMVLLCLGWCQYRQDLAAATSTLRTIVCEGERLVPSDFQVKLVATAHASAFEHVGTTEYEPPQLLALHMDAGKIYATGELVLRDDPATAYPATRSPNRS